MPYSFARSLKNTRRSVVGGTAGTRVDRGKGLSSERRSILSIHLPVRPVCLELAAAASTASNEAAAAGVNVLRIQDSFDSPSPATCRSAMLGLLAITAVSCDTIVEWLYDTGPPGMDWELNWAEENMSQTAQTLHHQK
jgi:hypothetical protein